MNILLSGLGIAVCLLLVSSVALIRLSHTNYIEKELSLLNHRVAFLELQIAMHEHYIQEQSKDSTATGGQETRR